VGSCSCSLDDATTRRMRSRANHVIDLLGAAGALLRARTLLLATACAPLTDARMWAYLTLYVGIPAAKFYSRMHKLKLSRQRAARGGADVDPVAGSEDHLGQLGNSLRLLGRREAKVAHQLGHKHFLFHLCARPVGPRPACAPTYARGEACVCLDALCLCVYASTQPGGRVGPQTCANFCPMQLRGPAEKGTYAYGWWFRPSSRPLHTHMHTQTNPLTLVRCRA
jgi:hypothetical protein